MGTDFIYPTGTRRNNNFIMTSRSPFDAVMTLFLRCVSAGYLCHFSADGWYEMQNIPIFFNSLWFNGAIWRHRSGSALAHSTKLLFEPIVTDDLDQWDIVAFIDGNFYKECSRCLWPHFPSANELKTIQQVKHYYVKAQVVPLPSTTLCVYYADRCRIHNKQTYYQASYCFTSWAPSQYKDRLIYVWWFPC